MLGRERRRPADSLDARIVEEEPRWSTETPGEDPTRYAEQGELGRQLEAALGQLPNDQRLAVILSDIHGYQYDEIAEITGVPAGTVKSRLSRGRARLRDLLRADERAGEFLDAVIRRISEGVDQ